MVTRAILLIRCYRFDVCSLFVVYVGAATVGAAAWWFMSAPDGPHLDYYQLVSGNEPLDFINVDKTTQTAAITL